MADIRETPRPFSTFVDVNSTKGEVQDVFVVEMAERVRERAKSLNYNARSFGAAIGIKSSAAATYWNGERAYPTKALPRMADVLSTSVDQIVTGRDRNSLAVADAGEVEFEELPLFDLRLLTDTGKGPPQSRTPFRKDWLHRTLGTSFDLYLVQLLSDYHGRTGERDLQEGDLVFCREITPAELIDGHVVIWRREQGLKVARYSLRPRERVEEDVITPGEVSDDQFVPVARILGKFGQRI